MTMEKVTVPVYNVTGDKVGTIDLKGSVFGVAFNTTVVHEAVVAQQANARQVLAHTKGRGEVRGGGRKPWKQKGTGRARHGSRRSPLWVGGGITFGPTKERNFSLKVNKKVRRQAVRMVLSDKAKNDRLVVIESWNMDHPKTNELYKRLAKLPVVGRSATLITDVKDEYIVRASRNLPRTRSLGVGSLNVVDILKNEYVVVPSKLIPVIEKKLSL